METIAVVLNRPWLVVELTRAFHEPAWRSQSRVTTLLLFLYADATSTVRATSIIHARFDDNGDTKITSC